MSYAYNIPETILGRDGRTVYSTRHLSGNVFEIVPVNQRPQHGYNPGKKSWGKKSPAQVDQTGAKSAGERDQGKGDSTPVQKPAGGAPKKRYYHRGPKKPNGQAAEKKEEVVVAKSDD